MHINKLKIFNFKCFEEFTLDLNEGLNILVGDNESGKSTILEAVHLALSGLLNGKYFKLELTPDLFNNNAKNKYLDSSKVTGTTATHPIPPEILIELYFGGIEDDSLKALLEGNGNSLRSKACGVQFKISFNDVYKEYYEELVNHTDVQSIPTEYYEFCWSSFARERLIPSAIPIKSALIDSSSNRYRNGSDVYISRILKDHLNAEDRIKVDQAYRKLRDVFADDPSIKRVNKLIEDDNDISDKKVEISLDLSVNPWESNFTTYLDDVPFQHIGKGEQCIVKTKLALNHKKSQEANLLLLEEPENHLSHTKLNSLVSYMKDSQDKKQIIISTHSSFVANKLGLESLIMMNVDGDSRKTAMLNDLEPSTKSFFQKLAGYDTLRLILCDKAILVEGDSDELIVQKAYMEKHSGKPPIEDGIDVISVGTSFLRFLEIADKINKPVYVVTDNDGDYDNKVVKKYAKFAGGKYITICADNNNNLITLEPQIVDANKNNLSTLWQILNPRKNNCPDKAAIIEYMSHNKTECALQIFEATESIQFPKYILDAVSQL